MTAIARTIAVVRRELAAAEKKSARAAEARSRLPAGSSRARVTTANARWMRAAENRDRLLRELQDLQDQGTKGDRP